MLIHAYIAGPSSSMFSVFVGLKGNAKELCLPAHNTWLFPHWRHDTAVHTYRQSLADARDKPYIPLVFISFSSGKHKSHK